MDYINLYNLNINVKNQTVSIEHNGRTPSMNIDQDKNPYIIPVTLSKPVNIPPNCNRQAKVSIPVSSVTSAFIPNSRFRQNTSLVVAHKLLAFQSYSTSITLSNTSTYPKFIGKGLCIGFLFCYPVQNHQDHVSCHNTEYIGAASSSGEIPVGCNVIGAARISGKTPVCCRQIPSPTNINDTNSTIQQSPTCNAIETINPTVEKDICELISTIENQKQHDDLLTLLHHFHKIFDITKHNIANTPINHVINPIPHSPPPCRPYPQPNTEESMYKIIQEFLKAGLITDSHAPYAVPAILVKKKDGKDRLVIDYKKLNLITIKDSSPPQIWRIL
ncbi:unnamed protein product [Didymodactylos carnosus]|uniref:Uncharacterized protein n=1 Tax=Didymodactylos carnosus TaxID=1234261 RepID=A0A8S2QPT5_9BILA|nr:unnamed protein product [Didymodactylos carnosus]CAF4106006.1 unnamed protein product [Didymodactylos carnosus]